MVRAMLRSLLVIACVSACERAEPTPAATPPAPADKLDGIVDDTLAYMDQLPPILLAFDGDCGAHAARLLALEPLVSSIRKRSEELLTTNPDSPQLLRDRLMTHKSATLAKLEEQLRAKGATRADVEAKERDVKTKCGDDARVKDAMDRVGLFKKKS